MIRHWAGVYPRAARTELLKRDIALFERRYWPDGSRRRGPWAPDYDWLSAYEATQVDVERVEAERLAFRRAAA